ncbi:MAG: FAD binding domain-containing protein [Caldilineaceae bacterium]|nr:FAD binding domain-containing protein [Caldilineaceae bacterium]
MALLNEYHKPATIREAIQLLGRTEANLVPLAGGSQLIGELETRSRRDVDGVVDLSGLGLGYIHIEDDHLCVGAMATISDLMAHPEAGALAGGILRRAARYEGQVNLRNAATIGGIVAAAEMDSELYAALLALGASIVTHDGQSETTTPLASTTPPLPAGEVGRGFPSVGLITEIRIPRADLRSGHARIARTPMDRPIVAAVAVMGDGVERVALCGVAGRPILDGDGINPISDFKGSAEYRREMAAVVRRRALAEAKGG